MAAALAGWIGFPALRPLFGCFSEPGAEVDDPRRRLPQGSTASPTKSKVRALNCHFSRPSARRTVFQVRCEELHPSKSCPAALRRPRPPFAATRRRGRCWPRIWPRCPRGPGEGAVHSDRSSSPAFTPTFARHRTRPYPSCSTCTKTAFAASPAPPCTHRTTLPTVAALTLSAGRGSALG